jgi:hypothetical protein
MRSLLVATCALALCNACKGGGDAGGKTQTNVPPSNSGMGTTTGPHDNNQGGPGGQTGDGKTGGPGGPGGPGGGDAGTGQTTTTGNTNTSGTGSLPAQKIQIAGTLAIGGDDALVVALPLKSGAVDPQQLRSPPTAAITSGKLTLELDAPGAGLGLDEQPQEDVSQVIAVYTAPPSGKRMDLVDTIKFVEMPVAGADSLVGLPTSALKAASIDLGTIADDAAGKTVASTAATDQIFDATPAELLSRAKSDDTMKSVKNTYVNTDPDTGVFFQPRLAFLWRGHLQPGMLADDAHLLAPVLNQASPEGDGDYPRYFGYTIGINTNEPSLLLDARCKDLPLAPSPAALPNGTTPPNFSLAPSGNRGFQVISEHEIDFNNDTILKLPAFDTTLADYYFKEEHACVFQQHVVTDDDSSQQNINVDMLSLQDLDGGKSTNVTFGGPRVIYGPVVTGVWELKHDGNPIAKFDLAVSDAVERVTVGSDTFRKPMVFVPSVQILRAAGTDEIEKVRVRLYTYDYDETTPANGKYDPASTPVVKKFVTSVGAHISDGNHHGIGAEVRAAEVADDAAYFEVSAPEMRDFVLPALGGTVPAGKMKVWSLTAFYEMFGNRYEMRLRCAENGGTPELTCTN